MNASDYERLGTAYAIHGSKAENAPSGQQTQAIDMLEEAHTLLSDIYFMRESFNADRVESFLDRAQPLLKSIHSAGPITKNAPTVNSDATQPISTDGENSANEKYREHEETERILNAGLTKVLDLSYVAALQGRISYAELIALVREAKTQALKQLVK